MAVFGCLLGRVRMTQRGCVAGVCADLLLSYQRNSVGVIGGGNGGDKGGSGRF